MIKKGNHLLKLIFHLVLVTGLWLATISAPALAQQSPNLQNLIVNGGFEEGFQDGFGLGYGWGGFSNGNAVVGWSPDTWEKVVIAGRQAQMIEIKNATDRDRYAGIFQTISVVPGQQYKLTMKGLIRSEEGNLQTSDYGYRLQYAIDNGGGTAWELVGENEWREVPWDEQPLYEPPNGVYRFDTFETTITATGDKLTLFIRGWKKWLNNGSGIYDLDEISLVGPAPESFQAAQGQAASVGNVDQPPEAELVEPDASLQTSEHEADLATEEPPAATTPPAGSSSAPTNNSAQPDSSTATETAPQPDSSTQTESPAQPESAAPAETPAQTDASTLPVSGRGQPDSINYMIILGVVLLMLLVGRAILATRRPRHPVD